MAAFTIHSQDIDGIAITFENAAAGGDTFVNDATERTYIIAKNADASSTNITFTNQLTAEKVPGFGQIDFSDKVIAVAAGATKVIGPFKAKQWNNTSGAVAVSYSSVTSLTMAAVKMDLP